MSIRAPPTSSTPLSPASPSSTRVIKVRAGGSGTSSLVSKPSPAPSAASAPAVGNASNAAAGLRSPAPAPASSASAAAAGGGPSRSPHRTIVIPARGGVAAEAKSPSKGSVVVSQHPHAASNHAASSSTAAAAAQPAASAASAPTAAAASSGTAASSAASSSRTSSHASSGASKSHSSSTYESPLSYAYPSEGSSGRASSTTPNGINLDLSGSNAAPSLLASRTRGERLRAACMREDVSEVASLLAAGVDANESDSYGHTPLMLSCATGNADVVEELLHRGAGLHAKDRYGQTALHHACAKGHYEVAKMLVEKKAGVNVQTMHGQTALMKVCAGLAGPHTGILAELLLRNHARPDLTSSPSTDGSAAIHFAVMNDHVELVEILAHYGANLNLPRSSDGNTAAHLAAERASFSMLSTLISLGADPQLRNSAGKSVGEVNQEQRQGAQTLAPDLFRSRLQAAIDSGLSMRADKAREMKEAEEAVKQWRAEKAKRERAELVAQHVREGMSLPDAEASADAALGLQGSKRHSYVDEDGVERTSSRPPSAKLTYAEMKARTYRPKIDPTSVFGDAPAVPAAASSSQLPAAASSSSSASSRFAPPASYQDALRDENGGDSGDEMQMLPED